MAEDDTKGNESVETRKKKNTKEKVYNNRIEVNPRLDEDADLDEAVLNRQQRRQRAITMRRYKSKIAAARKRSMRKAADSTKLEKRARKKAIKLVRAKVASQQGSDYENLDAAQKMIIDKKVAKRKSVVDRIAKRMLPKVRQAERDRRSGGTGRINEEFETLFENRVRQDPDIKGREGTQPAAYHSGLSKSTKAKRDAHFKKGAKMDDDNPAAYKPAPGDANAKTKESKHTKKYREMYGESYQSTPTKRFHQTRKKDGSIKLDRRFRAFKKASKPIVENDAEDRLRTQHNVEREKLRREHEKEMDAVKTRNLRGEIRKINREEVEFETDASLIAMIEEVSDEISESILLDEAKAMEGLKKKAEKSGIPYSTLKKVYDRGVAAWRTGHRPGTTPQQWGYARVNSFITGGKTRTTADADLAKGLKEDMSETIELFNINESYEHLAESDILDKALAAIHKHVKLGGDPGDVSFRVSQARGVNFTPKQLLRKYQERFGDATTPKSDPERIARLKRKYGFREFVEIEYGEELDEGVKEFIKNAIRGFDDEAIKKEVHSLSTADLKNIVRKATPKSAKRVLSPKEYLYWKTAFDKLNRLNEEGGAGERGTDKLTKRYKKDTPCECDCDDMNESFELHEAEQCQLVGMKQIKEFEKIVDKLFEKFGIDFKFTKHFADRMGDERNNPCISLKELAEFIKKVYAKQGKSLKDIAGTEAVLKDVQRDLNLPVAVTYDRKNDEFDVVMKTIMRKKNFRTPNKIIKY